MSFNPNMLLDTTPNSSKLAEMLLRLREEAPAITSLSYLDQSQIIPSLNQLSPPATVSPMFVHNLIFLNDYY